MRRAALRMAVIALSLAVVSCAGLSRKKETNPQVYGVNDKVPAGGGRYKIGKPYKIAGGWYRPRENRTYDKIGVASWYGEYFHGRKTANGEYYDMTRLSAAHPTLPLPVYARVTNLENNRSLVVRINDRGPYARDRIIDLSKRAAQELGVIRNGTAKVRVTYLADAPLDGDITNMQALGRGLNSNFSTASITPLKQKPVAPSPGNKPSLSAKRATGVKSAATTGPRPGSPAPAPNTGGFDLSGWQTTILPSLFAPSAGNTGPAGAALAAPNLVSSAGPVNLQPR